MSKPRIYGVKSAFVPNSKADMRYRQKMFLQRKEAPKKNAERKRGLSGNPGTSEYDLP